MKPPSLIIRVILLLVSAVLIARLLWPFLKENSSSRPLDPAFARLDPLDLASLPLAARFDQPMGSARGAFTYNAQPFRMRRHLGDDLNGIGGENSDLGDSVFSAGAGRVVYSGCPGPGWGGMVIVAHRLPEGDELGPVVQTMYAHLDSTLVQTGRNVFRGQQIGTVGTAGGAYLAHLHFEVRRGPYVNPGQGYADTPLNRVSPDQFIRTHRGALDLLINQPPEKP